MSRPISPEATGTPAPATPETCRNAPPHRFHYAWIVVAVTFLTLLTTAGIRSTPGVLIVPLEHEFGWSRASISVAVSVNLLLYGLMGPFAAAFFDKFGIRRTMSIALLLLAAGASATVFISKPWHLILIWGVVVGCGAGMTAFSLSATVVNRWFGKSRGTVMGVLTASAATGQLLFLPFLATLTHRHGWRAAALSIACAALIVLPLVVIFMRNSPELDLCEPPGGRGAGRHLRRDGTHLPRRLHDRLPSLRSDLHPGLGPRAAHQPAGQGCRGRAGHGSRPLSALGNPADEKRALQSRCKALFFVLCPRKGYGLSFIGYLPEPLLPVEDFRAAPE